MWKGPDQDPGGGPSQELSELKDQFEQQQVLIAQLKEMIRKNEQSNVTQEKVDEYMNTLSKRGRLKRPKKDDENRKTVEIPASQKISLLRQQVEENKLKLAERGKSQKGIEEMVTQLKAQLDDSQQLMSPLNLSIPDNKIEYSENSSSQELYMVLLTKEKRISDLLTKMQKLESNVLDLQENLKEKDSVIDARTKAITLMTENLSRKGKTTLDALDETKEQMRKMQENFIKMEADMKARQMKLLDDLRQKNYEIAELQETNASLEKQIIEDVSRETSSEDLDALKAENARLVQMLTEKNEAENEEINKLRKQLEDSNKNMIKVKAQHKSKVKELTKKIESFKKVSDANAEIVKLEAENCRLSQKIAELEEEKGSLQLKLVDSDSAKGSDSAEHNELEEKLQARNRELEEKDKVISILEAEILQLKVEKPDQVKSEMASIQFEEQMDGLVNENKKLSLENESVVKEKEELIETIEQLKKEKQEMTSKLEHYIQENMELIDKLEKLSAEKVSSAESIEIVEGLTQQEKLELEAYQKNLDIVTGNMKTSEENLPQADLDESVNELNEESSELLQRIELFTVERREVMEKMEQLKQENLNLNLKIKEIENNRDVLAETYEQIQSEKEVLDSKLEAIEAENASLKEQISQHGDPERVKELEEEIAGTKLLIEERQTELDDLTKLVEDVKSQLEEKSKENSQLNNTIIELNRALADLQNDNKSLQMKVTQLEELIDKNQEELEAISNSEWENRRLLESKDNEITKLTKERDNTESVIADLQKTLKEKDEKFHKMASEFKDKYLELQKKLEDNSGDIQNITAPLQAKIEELTVKNKEQLEKMKKIAANLKKKTQAYQELENRHEVELKTSLQQLQDLEGEVSRLRQQLDDKCEEARVLEEKNVDLQNVVADLRVKADRSNEVNLQQELLLTKENLGTVEGSLRSKIQELEMIIETQESELVKTRERVNKLEEGISFVEERRLSLERKANELGAQLEEKSMTCEEMCRSEDFLEGRVAALIAHDEAIERKLEEANSENQELSQQNKNLVEKNEKLKKKLVELEEKIHTMEDQQNFIEDLEVQNDNFKKQIHNLENELKNLQNEYDRMVEESRADLDKVNADWQNQFEEILTERSELLIKCEKFQEEVKEITEKDIAFSEALEEYKTKLENSEVQIRNYEEQIEALSKDKEEMEQLRQMLEEKDNTIKNYEERLEIQIRSYEERIEYLSRESEDLRRIITEKEVEEKKSSNLATFFDSVPQEDPTIKFQEDLAASKTKIEEMEKIIHDLEAEKSASKTKLQELEKVINDLEAEKSELVAASKTKIEELEKVIHGLETEKSKFQQELQQKPVAEPQKSQQDIPVFHWSAPENDLFDFIEPTKVTTQEAPPPQNTQNELLEKIKTLQFMLFDAEKERDDALNQCQQLTNELGQLIYEKQTAVESQVLPENETKDFTGLQTIEFEETRPPVESSAPIVEEVIQPKEAYLCYSEEAGIESQVLSEADVVDTPETRRELQNIEFERTQPPTSSEEPCTSKDAYLCFGENDDGWGWGPEEAKLEEEHAQKLENVEGLRQRIRVLEMERENHVEEIRQLQVKSGKLIKKLKEMKAKNEEAQRKKSQGDLFNLDDAIQEEMKLQIQQVEKRLKETSAELEKEKNEKAAILKRIEVLTAANERLVEMKEKQDIEMLGWQQQYRELSAKLERFEWGDDGFSSEDKPVVTEEKSEDLEVLQKRIDELNETIKELSLDNEELQALLEEQRKLRIEAEKSAVQVDLQKRLEEEKQSLSNELHVGKEERRQLLDQVNELIKKNAELGDRLESLENVLLGKDEIVKKLNEKLVDVEREREEIWAQIQQKDKELEREKEEKNVLLKEKEMSEALRTSLEHEKETLKTSLELEKESIRTSLELEKETLFKELAEEKEKSETLRTSLEREKETIRTSLELEKEALFKELKEKNAQIDSLNTELANLAEKDTEIVRLTAAMDQMTQEWQMRIDQRGSDVAESWKLHLESRESEFAQTEELLRKEINELEEKTNALVNENNELRKNVDAEIRNEVDRVAALQQQISDRQQTISDLTKTLQEKQAEVDKLQAELTDKQQDLDDLKVKFGRSQEEHARSSSDLGRLNGLLEEREQTIAALNAQIQEMRNLKDYENENTQNLQQNLYEYQQINNSINVQLQAKVAQLDEKEREIVGLKLALEEKEREHSYALENMSQEYRASISDQTQEIETLKRRLADTENQYEELLNSKELELRHKSEVVEDLTSQLNSKIEECEDLRRKIEEQTVLIDEENKQLTELRAIIEEQVLKIEEMKKELYEKSNDYDSLIAEMDISRTKEPETQRQKVEATDEDLSEPVSRAELDLALYMLHQRDVRCEELTVELTQLLEERDTLQLRLSNVIREKEEMVRNATPAASATSTSSAPEVGVEALTTKLSELKTVGYKKDKTLVDEQDLRRLQQMSIMQQHRDAASKLPPEAAARLVDASYTLSRDVQSPSKVLLNWLWGRSTPKVNNI